MSLIGKFAHLPGRPNASEATPLLEKIASQVKPIMKKRGWKVGVLGEFFPANPALLGININRGQRINLRLRPPDNPSGFYDLEQLVLVMLHELTHIVHGPHDASFYKSLAELEEEYYDLRRKGYTGEGFHSDGNRLQGMRVNEYEGRRKGLAAAEKRLQQQRVMGRGGVLGGSRTAGKSMREIVAEAAQRRQNDDKTCKVDTKEAEEEARIAQEESVVVEATSEDTARQTEAKHGRKRVLGEAVPGTAEAPIVIDDYFPEDVQHAARISTSRVHDALAARSGSASLCSRTDLPTSAPPTSRLGSAPSDPGKPFPVTPESSRSANSSSPSAPQNGNKNTATGMGGTRKPDATASSSGRAAPALSATWSCNTCTLINPISASQCEACAHARPVPNTATMGAWWCEFCGAGPREMSYWSCLECGWVRKWG
ncbi:WLM-domain-containing protein [Cutaneotrichosporon oleaginosum]|uniref:WLM-domain-containing protein n=1 Tax=Cutaneotrichosporon oleaginosum TaxID=879819 RepID=A0A0J0XFQ9_9TREE|nr:WLM-domain-containing protein [Cutaneotrichosporon oleaginosum]KLT39896.1 WLM-domain-containing protein [Cutaneotrichosporon oleaginosum]TXT14218.1 hypothetical protein COLE_00411 [Cutaneotrichosporon oleaginosum]